MRTIAILLYIFTICFVSQRLFAQPLHSYIDPLIGSEGKGNVFIGPSCPFGMVKPGPDNDSDSNSGYSPDTLKPIFGFSHVHVSGTGGGPKYGNVSVMPYMGAFTQIEQPSLRTDQKLEAGFYGTTLINGNIRVEITTSSKVAFHRYFFDGAGEQGIKIDLGKFLGEEPIPDAREAQQFVGSEVEIVSDTEICGYTRIRGGWNNGAAYTVYFHAVLDKPFASCGTWIGGTIYPKVKSQYDLYEKTGAFLQFEGESTIQMKVGISFISTLKAKQNIESEVPHWDFAKLLTETQARWEELLSRIVIDASSTPSQRTMFYTALYHTMLMPVDRTGENPLWTAEPYYDDFYAIWDTYRTSSPLLTLISPKRQADIVNAMLNIYKYDGYLPEGRSGNSNGRTQGGSNAAVVIADAYVKGVPGISYGTALRAMLKDATIPPGGNEEKEGRGGLTDYNRLGYVSNEFVRAGNRTLEYALNDYCLAQVAKGLGRMGEYRRFMQQSNNWKNLWRDVESEGSQGFIMPRDANGSWIDSIRCDRTEGRTSYVQFTPLAQDWPLCVCWWCGFFYEGNSWEYSFFVPHDVPGLIEKCGGSEAFRIRLDTFFANGYYDVGNEPSFLTPSLYHWIGRPDLSSDRIRSIVETHYNATPAGIPGNDDSGAMSSWLAFHMMGLYPNAGHSYYLITAPHFKQVTIHQENGKKFIIKANKLSKRNCYIQLVKLNGKPYEHTWIEHQNLMNGGELVFEMGPEPSIWGRNCLPPQKIYQ
ncbi:MAG: GH92 family glycosyl hydrolase [Prolixibacteraceae bacterium]|nr:GH92 family glycosyl hydrolase [Prolixibacteraceae bacterium]